LNAVLNLAIYRTEMAKNTSSLLNKYRTLGLLQACCKLHLSLLIEISGMETARLILTSTVNLKENALINSGQNHLFGDTINAHLNIYV